MAAGRLRGTRTTPRDCAATRRCAGWARRSTRPLTVITGSVSPFAKSARSAQRSPACTSPSTTRRLSRTGRQLSDVGAALRNRWFADFLLERAGFRTPGPVVARGQRFRRRSYRFSHALIREMIDCLRLRDLEFEFRSLHRRSSREPDFLLSWPAVVLRASPSPSICRASG